MGEEFSLWPRSNEGLCGLARAVRGSVVVVVVEVVVAVIPFWADKELNVSGAPGRVPPTLGGLLF